MRRLSSKHDLLSLRKIAIAVPLLCQATHLLAQMQGDLDTIRRRYVASLLPRDAVSQRKILAAASLFESSLSANATWADVDYTNTARSQWPAAHHLDQTLLMAKAVALDRQAGKPNPELEAETLSAFRLWIARDPRNPNWWWNQIGVPELLGEIAALLRPQITTDDMERLRPFLMRASWTNWTGANLVWGVTIEIVRGTLYRDSTAVAQGYERLYQEVRIVPSLDAAGKPGEGIQEDDSFHQHGAQFYSGGYGLDYANDVGRFIAFSWGTAFQIPADRMRIYSAFVLDGEQWMIRKSVFDYAAVGREITRPDKAAFAHDWTLGPISGQGAAYSLGNVAAALAAEPTPRQKEFRAFADRLNGVPGASQFCGDRQFWNSDYMAHRRRGYFASVRMFSTRTQNFEVVNGEGLQSMHLADGLNLLYRTGNEYRNIFPVWDWALLPGTTALRAMPSNGATGTLVPDSEPQRGQTSFVGGVSDGRYGAAAMDLKRGPLSAEKAWFFFDKLYVALGAGITATNGASEIEVATDVNQSLLSSEVLVNGASQALDAGTHSFAKHTLHTVWHDHDGYVLGSETIATLSNQVQTGRWSEIGAGPDGLVSKAVFNLWIHDGIAPRDATYQYTVLPSASIAETAAEYRHPSATILSNTVAIQSVYVRRLQRAEVVFHRAGSLETPLGRIAVDHPALLMVARSHAGLVVTAANPENKALTLQVTIGSRPVLMRLPEGKRAGSSVTVSIAGSHSLHEGDAVPARRAKAAHPR